MPELLSIFGGKNGGQFGSIVGPNETVSKEGISKVDKPQEMTTSQAKSMSLFTERTSKPVRLKQSLTSLAERLSNTVTTVTPGKSSIPSILAAQNVKKSTEPFLSISTPLSITTSQVAESITTPSSSPSSTTMTSPTPSEGMVNQQEQAAQKELRHRLPTMVAKEPAARHRLPTMVAKQSRTILPRTVVPKQISPKKDAVKQDIDHNPGDSFTLPLKTKARLVSEDE